MLINRIEKIAPAAFLEAYIVKNQPVIVADAIEGWAARTKWTPEYLSDALGDFEVQVYDDLFDLVDVMPLADYLDGSFGRDDDACAEYVRWYSRLKNVDFHWADEAFERLRDDWSHPYFLGKTGYAVPHRPGEELSPAASRFPYRGLFISGRGARTRLHRDPWTSSAVLCQFYGDKQLTMYAPEQAACLMNGDEFVDPAAPDPQRFPRFAQARPAYEDTLKPGEVLYIPSGWFHDVTSVTDSISVTWNFVHESRVETLCQYLTDHPHDSELEVLRFFLNDLVPPAASAGQIVESLRSAHRGSTEEPQECIASLVDSRDVSLQP
jgi:hypothetical protein